jgi:hypothetical protein
MIILILFFFIIHNPHINIDNIKYIINLKKKIKKNKKKCLLIFFLVKINNN